MEFVDAIPFSSMIAGMLLCEPTVSAVDIINLMSRLSVAGIDVVDDDIDFLSICIEINSNCSFYLKDGYDYDTKIDDDMTIAYFLEKVAGKKILSFLSEDVRYCESYHNYYQKTYESPNERHHSFNIKNTRRKSRIKNKFVFVPFLSVVR